MPKLTSNDFEIYEQESYEDIDAEMDMLREAVRKRNYEMISHHAKNIMIEAIKAEAWEYTAGHIE